MPFRNIGVFAEVDQDHEFDWIIHGDFLNDRDVYMLINHIVADHFLKGLLANMGGNDCDILAAIKALATENFLSN